MYNYNENKNWLKSHLPTFAMTIWDAALLAFVLEAFCNFPDFADGGVWKGPFMRATLLGPALWSAGSPSESATPGFLFNGLQQEISKPQSA